MTPYALLPLVLAAPPDGWEFRDESTHAGRSVLTYRDVALADASPKLFHPDDRPSAGARAGVVALGSGGRLRVGVVWHPASGAVWVDADGDGRFAAWERHALAAGPLAVPVAVPFGAAVLPRTLLVRRRGDGLAAAVRGFAAGPLALGSRTCPAMLTDGDADGAVDGPADRLWVDLDGDGRFDPLTEQFPVGRPVAAGGTLYLVRPDPAGRGVVVTERPPQTGRLGVDVTRLPGATVVGLTARFASEWGELVTVTAADEAADVPVGRYQVQSLALTLADADGRTWGYAFAGDGRAVATVEPGRAAWAAVTAGLAVRVTARAAPAWPGRTVAVTPDVVTAAGLRMTGCEAAEKFAPTGRRVEATVRLTGDGSALLAETRGPFQCGRLGTHPLAVPDAAAGPVEAAVVVPTGPLAGDVRGWVRAPDPPKQ